jgi:prepilin-type N-terminal cleavage/methylation domain-containing protein
MKKAFTLIELIVVIAIISILALILVPQIIGYTDDATNTKEQANSKVCYTEALALWTGKDSTLESTVTIDGNCTIYTSTSGTGVSGSVYTSSHDVMPISAAFGDWKFLSSNSTFVPK